MSLDSDVIVDRRRIRRKLTFWRVAAAVIAIAAIVGVGVIAAGGRGGLSTSNAIARINIDGLIRSDQQRVEALERENYALVARWRNRERASPGTPRSGGAGASPDRAPAARAAGPKASKAHAAVRQGDEQAAAALS